MGDEDHDERVNRELIELLNELRVALPGVQTLFAFMLILPFSQGFSTTTSLQRAVYFASFLCTAASTALLIAPSTYHRVRFRKHDKERMLITSNKLLLAGSLFLMFAISGSVFVVTDTIIDERWASIIAAITAGWFAWFWYGLPISRRVHDRR